MGWQTIVLIVVIGLLVVFAVVKYLLDRKKGKKCAGGCAGCNITNCPSRKFVDNDDNNKSQSDKSNTKNSDSKQE